VYALSSVFNFGGLVWRSAIPPLPEGRGFLAEII
jgi:hypothetical protein